jgi:polar amino acid transport system permease protein
MPPSGMEKIATLLSFGDQGWGDELLQGAGVTLGVAIVTLPIGLALGLIIALLRHSRFAILRGFSTLYTTIFRGVPELLTLFIIYFGAQILLQRLAATLGYTGRVEFSPFFAGVVALALVLAAFSSEVWLGALNSIQKGQREAAAALGLSKRQAFRLVIFPQLMRVALPGLGNNWMVLLKETSLVSVITLHDIMFIATRANIVTKEPFLFFSVAGLLYLSISMVSSWGISRLEARSAKAYTR